MLAALKKLSRDAERWRSASTRPGTTAGLVLSRTFIALGSLPIILGTEIGFVVRSVLVTAPNLDIGRRAACTTSAMSHARAAVRLEGGTMELEKPGRGSAMRAPPSGSRPRGACLSTATRGGIGASHEAAG